MKATGIVRRIDDLGRVVIPKEIRRTMRIRDGEPLEIFTNNEGEVVFKKYSPIGEVGVFTSQYAEAINKSSGIPVAICDKDNVIAVSGLSKKDYLDTREKDFCSQKSSGNYAEGQGSHRRKGKNSQRINHHFSDWLYPFWRREKKDDSPFIGQHQVH